MVLENAKSLTWKFFKFWVAAGEVDRSYVHCKLCLDDGQRKKGLIVCLFVRETYTCSGQIKYCGGTTNMPQRGLQIFANSSHLGFIFDFWFIEENYIFCKFTASQN